MDNKNTFRHFGTMLDCSRNAVMSVPSVKRWIDLTSDLGYNSLMLYTEDTYEVDDNPYFGYMRGRYSQEELKEIDAYAASKGMELIPCIQTLGHFTALLNLPAYRHLRDADDVILAGEDEVYELIDKIFASISKCFRTKTINIGLDEAHSVGRGKYMDIHGPRNRFDIFLEHLQKVAKIGEKYGFQFLMWSDLFFHFSSGSVRYTEDAKIDAAVSAKIPDNVQLTYWDYYSTNKKHYDTLFKIHEKIKPGTWFAGGLWAWSGFTPSNTFSLNTTNAALRSCRSQNIQDVILTIWGDDGGECSAYALLPTLFYASEAAKGNTKMSDIKKKFKEKYGIAFDQFMLLDLPGTSGVNKEVVYNPSKYLLYNDCFTGLLDSTLAGGEGAEYAAAAKRLRKVGKGTEWRPFFESQQALCEALAIKAELGVRTREVYQSKDQDALLLLIKDYQLLLKKLDKFYRTYKALWFSVNKPHGFDVQEIRLTGLIGRVRGCMERLQDLANGKISVIEELEEIQLDAMGNGTEFSKKPINLNSWKQITTTNVISW